MEILDQGRKIKVLGVTLGKLSPNDRAAIMASIKADRRAKMLDTLKAAGITGAEFFNEVDAFDQEGWGDARWLGIAPVPAKDGNAGFPGLTGILDTYEGRAAIIERAGTKEHGDKWKDVSAALDGITINDTYAVIAALDGLTLVRKDPEASQEAGDPRPSEPAS